MVATATAFDLEPIVLFTTKKGSEYAMDKHNRCQRIKSYHPEHGVKDQGKKEIYNHIVFLDDFNANKMAWAMTLERDKWMVINTEVKMIGFIGLNADETETEFICGPFEYEEEPHLDLCPVEMFELQYRDDLQAHLVKKKYHFGNKIVDVVLV